MTRLGGDFSTSRWESRSQKGIHASRIAWAASGETRGDDSVRWAAAAYANRPEPP